jgi:hypothetical protein
MNSNIVDIYNLKNFNNLSNINKLKLSFVIDKNIISEIWANNDIIKPKDVDLKIKICNNESYISRFSCDISNIIKKYLDLKDNSKLSYQFRIKNLSCKIRLQRNFNIITMYDGLKKNITYFKNSFMNNIFIYDIFDNNNIPVDKVYNEQNGIFEIIIFYNNISDNIIDEKRYTIKKNNLKIYIFDKYDLINTHIIFNNNNLYLNNQYMDKNYKIVNINKIINKYELPIYENTKKIGIIILEEYLVYEKRIFIFSKLIDYNNNESIQITQINNCDCIQYKYFLKNNKDLNDDNLQKKLFKCSCYIHKIISKINNIYKNLYFNSDDITKIFNDKIKFHFLTIDIGSMTY